MANLHQLLIHQLHASQTRCLKEFYLRFHQEVKGNLRHEQTGPRTGRVTDGRSDILVLKVVSGVDGSKRVAKDVVEDVIYPCTS